MLESDKTPEQLEADDGRVFRFIDIDLARTGYRDIVSWWTEGEYGPVEVPETMGESPLPNPDSMMEFGEPGAELMSNFRKII